MKTPKRKHCDIYQCRECGGYGIKCTEDDSTSAVFECSLCGSYCLMQELPKHMRAIRARWTRKNREARLKNSLREKDWQIEVKKAQMRGYMRACVTLKSLLNKEIRLAAKYEKAVSASGTYGHDIEGS